MSSYAELQDNSAASAEALLYLQSVNRSTSAEEPETKFDVREIGVKEKNRFYALKKRYFWVWERNPLFLWELYGPIEVLLFLGIIAVAVALSVLSPFGDTVQTRLNVSRIYFGVLIFITFRGGYVITKYLELALEIFHSQEPTDTGERDRVLDHILLEPSSDDGTAPQPEEQQEASIRQVNGIDERSNASHNHCRRCLRRLKLEWQLWLACAIEFLQVFQLLDPVLGPYLAVASENQKQKGLSSILNIPKNVNDALSLLPLNDDELFWLFFGLTLLGTVLIGITIILPFLLREPWAVKTLKLSRQGLLVAKYELQSSQCCAWWITPLGNVWIRILEAIFDWMIRKIGRARQRNIKWRERFSFTARKFADITFIPLSLHLVGLVAFDKDDTVTLYPSFHFGGEAFFNKLVAAFSVFPFWFLFYSTLYCFEGTVLSVTSRTDNGNAGTEGTKQKLRLHPRFLYKMHFTRVVVILLGSLSETSQGLVNDYVSRLVVPVLTISIRCSHANFGAFYGAQCPQSLGRDDRSEYKRSIQYPTRVKWFNIWHRALLEYIASLAILVLVSYFFSRTHGIDGDIFAYVVLGLLFLLFLIAGIQHYYEIHRESGTNDINQLYSNRKLYGQISS